MSKPRILVARAIFPEVVERLAQHFEVESNPDDVIWSPHELAARLVLGVHGRGASDADVKLFADAMADNLMARYGSTLLDIQGKPSFRFRSEAALPGNRGVKVSTELVRAGSEPTPVEYLMRDVGGQWKIFDVMIEGISYVQTFKNQFDTPLRQKSIKDVAAELRGGSLQASAGPAPRGK